MKPAIILILGTTSLLAIISKLCGLPISWVAVLAPLWMPTAFAYLAFVVTIIHALGTGKLEIAPAPVTAEVKSEAAAQKA